MPVSPSGERLAHFHIRFVDRLVPGKTMDWPETNTVRRTSNNSGHLQIATAVVRACGSFNSALLTAVLFCVLFARRP
jgi:hypothetical protein